MPAEKIQQTSRASSSGSSVSISRVKGYKIHRRKVWGNAESDTRLARQSNLYC